MRGFLARLSAALLLCVPGLALGAAAGDVVITEILIASGSGTAEEWIELYNPGSAAVDLTGCSLADVADSTVLGSLVVQPGSYAILSYQEDCVVYDESGTCTRPSDLVYSGIQLNNSGEDQVEITCDSVLVDRVLFEWEELDEDCLAPDGGHCTANLRSTATDHLGNDQWPEAWCVPPATEAIWDAEGGVVLATPAAAGVCPEVGAPCGPGDAVFTEFMPDPPGSREWFEMRVTTGSGCDLHDCEIWEGDYASGDDDDSADGGTPEEWTVHVIDAPGGTLPIDSGQYVLFAKTHQTIAEADGGNEAILADYVYSNITLQNSDPAWMRLVCGGVDVDAAPYDKSAFETLCPQGGCSANLPEGSEHDEVNDDLSVWCLAPDSPTWISSDGEPFTATPGAVGACLDRGWPQPGEIAFSEIMVQPDDFPEWVEIANLTDREIELSGCDLRKVRLDGVGGEELLDTQDSHTLGSLGSSPRLDPWGVLVLTGGGCIDGSEESAVGTCPWGEDTHYVFESLSFTNGERERLSIVCPDGAGEQVAEQTVYDATRSGNRSGHSMEFDVTQPGAADLNDDPYAWCEASFDDCIEGLVTEEGECNYGTPGTVGPCRTGQVEIPLSGPGCRCDLGESPSERGAAAMLGLFLGGLGVLRRRRVR